MTDPDSGTPGSENIPAGEEDAPSVRHRVAPGPPPPGSNQGQTEPAEPSPGDAKGSSVPAAQAAQGTSEQSGPVTGVRRPAQAVPGQPDGEVDTRR